MSDPELRRMLVAHRGYPRQYPENSLSGLEAALALGAAAVEFDIQFSRDRQPVLLHDARLERTTETRGDVRRLDYQALRQIRLKPQGSQQTEDRLPSLAKVARLLQAYPQALAFVEAKSESLAHVDHRTMIDSMVQTLACCSAYVVIAKDLGIVQQAHKRGLATGWILPNYRAATQRQAETCQPDYLIVNRRRLPSAGQALWPGPWQWMVYTVNDLAGIQRLQQRGVHWVETDCIGELL